jgi:hypothetical protein
MFEFDEAKVADKLIEEEVHYSRDVALHVVKACHNLPEKLRPAFLTWLSGGIPEFEYAGFTLEDLKELTKCSSYFSAIMDMELVLENPTKWIPFFKDFWVPCSVF